MMGRCLSSVLKGGGQAIVIDTGFDADMAARRSRKLTRPVAEGLKAAGVDLAEVKDVVLTHMPSDHAGITHRDGPLSGSRQVP